MIAVVRQRSRTKAWVVVVLVLLLTVIGSVSYLAWRQSVPVPRATVQAPKFLGHNASVTVALEAARGQLQKAEVRIVQGGALMTIARPAAPLGPQVTLPILIQPAALGLKEGAATIEVWGADNFWRPLRPGDRALTSVPVTIDLTPPRLELLAATRYISPGGAVLVAFRAPDASRVDVNVGPRTFPSFPYGPTDRGARIALIALPYDFVHGTPLTVTARDEAGNTAARGLPVELKPRAFPKDTITLSEAFLQTKVPELLPQRAPTQPLIDGFLIVNRDQRKQAEDEKLKIGAKTADKPLWEGPFAQPRNTKVFSNFAETRTYVYDGQAGGHAGPRRLRPRLDQAVTGAGRQRRPGGLRRPAHDLRQRGHRRPRPRPADALRAPVVHRREAGRHGHQGPAARPHGTHRPRRAAITCTSRSSSPACR